MTIWVKNIIHDRSIKTLFESIYNKPLCLNFIGYEVSTQFDQIRALNMKVILVKSIQFRRKKTEPTEHFLKMNFNVYEIIPIQKLNHYN